MSQRWSSTSDFIHGIQHIARLALLVRAEGDDQIEDVEDQLFRFSRILDSETRLITLLSEYTAPLDGRISLLNNVLGRRASKNAADLLRQTVELLHGERADDAVRDLANLAVSRRGEVVAMSAPPTSSATLSATGSPNCSPESTAIPLRFSWT